MELNECRFCAQCLDDIESLLNVTAYCKQCREYICSDMCLRQHAKFRLSKSHTFILDDELKEFLRKLGISPREDKYERLIHTNAAQKEKELLDHKQAVLRIEFNIRTEADKEICSINAAAVLGNMNLALADLKNSKIKVFSTDSRKCIGSLELERGPKNICVSSINENEMFVLENGVKGIHVVSSENLSIIKTIPTEGVNFGIACWKRGIAVTTTVFQTYYGHYELRLLDFHGRVQRKIVPGKMKNLEFNLPWYICSNNKGQHILVSDYGIHRVTCLDVDGDVLFVYTDKELLRPVSMATDESGDIFVVGQRSHNIHHLNQLGNKCGTIYSTNAMEFPGGIAFDKRNDRFYVQCIGWSDLVQVFDVVVKPDLSS